MATTALDPQITADLAALAATCGCELVHVEFAGRTLRLYLDRPEGVTLADCEQVSRQAGALLDATGFGSDRYLLEVSSPGLDRPLFRPQDYDRFAGRLARVTFKEPTAARKRTIVGRLSGREAAGADVILVAAETPAKTPDTLRIPLAWISAARLEIEL
jgi:ribosome maturation factor RimP